ncbi:hypothetical protein SLEP1_g234 [Rubroshorea leprosula]|uniref:HMA domain-containing protein n=1 Tax=Rubroshorea leprosula TaxID=152421 RepID=A0AAV5HI41_9ROSI|nr:hypothetical protein SLEP1_g234 [Rubroshorea leprosula]
MSNDEGNEDEKVVVAEFNVSMHCNACERTVANVISKLKGVEKFTTDMNRQKVVVTGKIDPKEVQKKLKEKTRKKVEMVVDNEKGEKAKEVKKGGDVAAEEVPKAPVMTPLLLGYGEDSDAAFWIFSDENPNACSIM